MANCIVYNNLSNEEQAIHNHIAEFSKAALYDIWNALNQTLPKTTEEANAYIEQYKNKKTHEDNLNTQPTVQEILDNFAAKEQEVVKEGEIFRRVKDNSRVNRVSELLEMHKQRSNYYSNNSGELALAPKKGTVLHAWLQHISEALMNDKEANLLKIRKQIIEDFKQHPDFKSEANSFFELTSQQFRHLSESVLKLKKSINEIQKRIDPKGKITVKTEQLVFDKSRNTVGTIDMVVLFSDGSAAIYDYKSKSFGKHKTITSSKRYDWMFQLSNYANMLRDIYGISNLRQSRIIPIDVSFQNPKDRTEQIRDGFQMISMLNDDYLKPIAVKERTEYRALDTYITNLENKRAELLKRKELTNKAKEQVKFTRQINSIDNTLQSLYLDRDAGATLSKITDIAKYYESKIHLTKYDEGGFDLNNLTEIAEELKSYSGIVVAFSEEIRDAFKTDKDRHAKLSSQVRRTEQLISNLLVNVEQKIFDHIGNKHIYLGGQRISGLMKQFGGLDSINVEAMKEANLILVQYMEEARMKTEKQFSEMNELYKDVIEWGKNNGYSETSVMELFYDQDVNLVMEYTSDFYDNFKTFTRKHRKGEKLTAEEKKWLSDNFVIDQKAWKNHQKKALEGLKEQLEKKQLVVGADYQQNKDRYDQAIKLMKEETDPNKPENFYKGNYKKEAVFIVPKKGLKQYYSDKYQTIVKNQPLLKYYNKWREVLNEYIEDFGSSRIGQNFIPNIHEDLASMVKDASITHLASFAEVHLNKFKYREGDDTMGAVETSSGRKVKVIPLAYVDNFNITMSETVASRLEQEAEAIVGKDSEAYEDLVKEKKREWYNEKRKVLKNKNIHRSFLMFIAAANEYNARHTVKEYWDGIKFLMESDNFQRFQETKDEKAAYDKTVGDVAKIMGANEDLIKQFNHFYDRLIYGQKFEKDYKIADKYSLNKVARAMSTYVSANFVGFHPILAASNYITARNNFKMFTKEGRWWKEDSSDKALKWWGNRDERIPLAYEYFKPTNRSILQELADESTNFSSKWLRLKTLFWMHIRGDERIDAVIAASMADTWVLDSDGVIKNPLTTEIINKEAKPVIELIKKYDDGTMEIEGLSMREYARFHSKMRKIANEVKGMADQRQLGIIHASLTGSQLMLLRSWMPGMARARMKTLQFDLTLEEIDQGRYLIAYEEMFKKGFFPGIENFIKMIFQTITFQQYKLYSSEAEYKEFMNNKIKRFLDSITPEEKRMILEKYGDKFTIDQFIKMHEGKMRALAYELRMYTAWFSMLIFLGMLDFDEREEDNIFTVFRYNSHEIARRALLELTFWTSPQSAMQIIRSPFAMAGAIQNLQKVVGEWIVETSYMLRGERDPSKKSFPGYYTVKNMPVVNRVNNIYKLFEEYNRPKTTLERIFWKAFKDDE